MDNVDTKLRRWRLILGKESEKNFAPLSNPEDIKTDLALSFLYDNTYEENSSKKSGNLSPTSPKISKWLGDIRSL
jgi:hypothetical protein